ncbi:MAG: hypothetical protein LBU81_00885 [Methanosarcinales archaeon]|nr:hypothetical protein [Methanosarcinales archaeon]
MMKSSGNVSGFAIDLTNPAVKQISEGKTTVVFEMKTTAESGLDRFIENLIQGGLYGGSELLNFRRLPGCRR